MSEMLAKIINQTVNANKTPELLSYEIIDALKNKNLLPKSKDEGDLISDLEEVIFKHEEESQVGICKLPLAAKITKLFAR